LTSKIYGIEEVVGSIPSGSTNYSLTSGFIRSE
jgi:hypothetical protein